MASEYPKSHIIVAVLGFAGVVVTTVSSNWDKLFSRPALTPPATSIPLVTAPLPDPTPLPDTPVPRVTPTPRVTPIPHSTLTPRVAPPAPDTPTPPATPMRITSPHHGDSVGQKIAVEGVMAALRPEQHAFLCVQSQAFGRRIYPQGPILPDATGQWRVDSIYGSPGYRYVWLLANITAFACKHVSVSADITCEYPCHSARINCEYARIICKQLANIAAGSHSVRI